jgi:hypothetical protein
MEGAGCGPRVDGNRFAEDCVYFLAQPAAGGTIRPVDLHNGVPDDQELTAQASPKGPGTFNGKNRPAAPLKRPVLENAVTLTIGGNAALPKSSSIGRQGHGDIRRSEPTPAANSDDDDRVPTIGGRELTPAKARILLMLALQQRRTFAELQAIFDRAGTTN